MMVGESNNTEKYKLIDIRNVYVIFFLYSILRFIVMLFPQKFHISYSLLILFWIVVTIYPYLWIFDGGDCTFFLFQCHLFFFLNSIFFCCCCFMERAKKKTVEEEHFFCADGEEGHHVIYINFFKKGFLIISIS